MEQVKTCVLHKLTSFKVVEAFSRYRLLLMQVEGMIISQTTVSATLNSTKVVQHVTQR